MVEKIKEYFETEYRQTERYLNSELRKSMGGERDAVWYALQRCLGVAQFVQTANNVPFEIVEPLYEEIKNKLEKLLDN